MDVACLLPRCPGPSADALPWSAGVVRAGRLLAGLLFALAVVMPAGGGRALAQGAMPSPDASATAPADAA
ncbi:MAG: hypothetical protein NTW37_04400 [Proteobacteria bacterium]|nr:hypothetical protein [Pseudomonadota bacterium]